jgi:hypothetical protein
MSIVRTSAFFELATSANSGYSISPNPVAFPLAVELCTTTTKVAAQTELTADLRGNAACDFAREASRTWGSSALGAAWPCLQRAQSITQDQALLLKASHPRLSTRQGIIRRKRVLSLNGWQ